MLNRPVQHFAARVIALHADMKLSGRDALFVEFDFALLRNGYRVTCALTPPGGPGRDGLPIPSMSASWQDYEATQVLGDLLRGEIFPGGDGLDYLRGPLGPCGCLTIPDDQVLKLRYYDRTTQVSRDSDILVGEMADAGLRTGDPDTVSRLLRASLHKSCLRLDEDFTWVVELSMRKSWDATDIPGSIVRFSQAMDDHYTGSGDSILEGLSERFCPELAEAEPAPAAFEPAF